VLECQQRIILVVGSAETRTARQDDPGPNVLELQSRGSVESSQRLVSWRNHDSQSSCYLGRLPDLFVQPFLLVVLHARVVAQRRAHGHVQQRRPIRRVHHRLALAARGLQDDALRRVCVPCTDSQARVSRVRSAASSGRSAHACMRQLSKVNIAY
jgi:hypothetical protein